jgi:hypothetical protein
MTLPGANVDCQSCGDRLRTSKDSPRGLFKTCPNCSGLNGREHMFRKWPEAFGTTEKRIREEDPDGSQSWCEHCRFRRDGAADGLVPCSTVGTVELNNAKPKAPTLRRRTK